MSHLPFHIGEKVEGQGQGSQTTKHIEGDRVAGVSYLHYSL